MNNKKLAFLLKLFVVILAALGLVLFGLCIPSLLHELILFYRRTLNEELPAAAVVRHGSRDPVYRADLILADLHADWPQPFVLP